MNKKLAILLICSCAFSASIGVSYGQDQSPGKVQKVTTVKQLMNESVAIELTTIAQNDFSIEPEREVITFAEAFNVAPLVQTHCKADADYGDQSDKSKNILQLERILNYNQTYLLATKPLTHSSGGLSFSWC